MDIVDHYLNLAFKQSLGKCQPPADGRQRLLQAAAQYKTTIQVSSRETREPMGPKHPLKSNEPIEPLVRIPLLSAEKGWG
jgi:hypothetical protein